MYIWRKRTGPGGLRDRIEPLTQRVGSRLVLVERPGQKRTLLEISCRTRKETQKLVREFGGTVEELRADWLQHFVKPANTNPLRVGTRLVILSAPGKRSGGTPTLVIPAEAAFGTGHHATTAMCVRLLERITRRFTLGWRMLDAGTGSGILALAGSRFGAARVLAIDNDPLALSTAKRNARANRAQNIEFITGDILKHKLPEKFDIITANLFSEILIKALPVWSRHLAPDGYLILSGILRAQERAVVRALRQQGFAVAEVRRRGKWVALLCSGGL